MNKTRMISSLLCSTLAVALFCVSCATPPGQPTAQVTTYQGPSVAQAQAEPYNGPKARIAVGDFQVKAAGAPMVIGDGVREMLTTSLFNTNRFIVLERQAMQDVLLEQDLGASGRVRRDTVAPIGRIEGAQLLVYGVVSEFQMGQSGTGLSIGIPNVPLSLGGSVQNAHMAIDLRLVDTATGRILFATRVEGKASDYSGGVTTQFGWRRAPVPVSLGSYQNTPMEKAIRVCIETAVAHLCNQTPQTYYNSP
jgi:curli biogenesis system outer membrane secretion channel CsgG